MAILFKSNSIKNLSFGKKRLSGRNNAGRITIYHRGGGCKTAYRLIDFKRHVWNVFGMITKIEYDPNRSAFIALIVYANGIICYNICIEKLRVGDNIITTGSTSLKLGNTLKAGKTTIGTRICCVENNFSKGAQYVRAAGAYATIMSKFKNIVLIKLKSGTFLKINSNNLVTIGTVSNFQFAFRNFRKAGFYRLRGWRPTVRGVAMNPIDHPHGGGQGKTSGGRPSVTPWGFITKGQSTRKKNKK